MAKFIPTRKACLSSANQHEQNCRSQLEDWVSLGQTQIFSDGMHLAYLMRIAAKLPNIPTRKEFLIHSGVGGI